jgi:hypothetical protein
VPLYGNFRANLFSDASVKVYPYTQTKIGIGFSTGSKEKLTILHQSFGIRLKDSPVSFGLCGELFSSDRMSILSIGFNIGFTF